MRGQAVELAHVGATSISSPKSRSAARRRTSIACWKSFRPNTQCGLHDVEQLPTTSARRRSAPRRRLERVRMGRLTVPALRGYIADVSGTKRQSTPRSRRACGRARVTRILRQIFLRPELQRVDENAHHHASARSLARSKIVDAFVQKSIVAQSQCAARARSARDQARMSFGIVSSCMAGVVLLRLEHDRVVR